MSMQITAVTLGVKDLEQSKKFYEGLGASIDKEFPGFVSLKLGDGSPDLALYPREGLAQMVGVSPEGAVSLGSFSTTTRLARARIESMRC